MIIFTWKTTNNKLQPTFNMMRNSTLLLVFIALIATSCQPKVNKLLYDTYVGFENADSIRVYTKGEKIKHDYESVGRINTKSPKIGSKCNFDKQMKTIKDIALESGANAVYVIENVGSKGIGGCRNVSAEMLFVNFRSPNTKVKVPEINYNIDDDKNDVEYAINMSYAYQLGNIPDQTSGGQAPYLESLKNQLIFGGAYTYFPKEKAGYGLDYDMALQSGELDNLAKHNFYIKEEIRNQYFGVHYKSRKPTKNQKAFSNITLGLGYLSHQNKTNYQDNNSKGLVSKKYTHGTMAGKFQFTYGIYLSKKIMLGFNAGFLAGFTKLPESYWNSERSSQSIRKESSSRMHFGVELKFAN